MIEDARIFLLDLNPSRGLGKELQAILESSFNFDIQLQEESIRSSVASCCSNEHLGMISVFNPDVIFIVLSPGQLKQLRALIQSLRREHPELPVMIVTEGGKPGEMIQSLKLGVADFIASPLKAIDIIPRLWRLLERKHRSDTLIHSLKEKLGLKQLIGKSPKFLAEIEKIPIVAKCDAGVVISGETGTGKELCARAIHYLSPRANKPFIPVNCGAIPTELVENELFGQMRMENSIDSSIIQEFYNLPV